MHSFYDFNYLKSIRIKNLSRLLIKAVEKQQEMFIWDRWISLYPYMTLQYIEFKSFTDYKNELLKSPRKHTEKSAEEIEAEMMPVIAKHEGRISKKE